MSMDSSVPFGTPSEREYKMLCPYCQSCVKGVHRLCCKEMRAIERIDVIVADTRHFTHVRELIKAIVTKQSHQRKGKQ